jgi:succinyl-diaminopimelate desuccinylase
LPDAASYRSQIADGRIYGPGCGDMKGQLAILLELFRTCTPVTPAFRWGWPSPRTRRSADCTEPGTCLARLGLRCRQAFIPDGGSLDRVTVEEKGVLHVRLTARGRAGHAARPWLAANALDAVMDAVRRLRDRFAELRTDDDDHWYPTVTLTVLRTDNSTVNRVPERAEALLDIRFPPPHKTASMMEIVRAGLGEAVEALVLVGDDPTHLAPDPLWLELVQAMTGQPVRQTRESGGSDAASSAATASRSDGPPRGRQSAQRKRMDRYRVDGHLLPHRRTLFRRPRWPWGARSCSSRPVGLRWVRC